MAKPHTRTGFVGTCPVCTGTFHVQKEVMVHHGFERPGHGSIVGDCWAVGRTPFELSCEATKEYRGILQEKHAGLVLYLAQLESGAITTVDLDESEYTGRGFYRRRVGPFVLVKYTSTETDPARKYKWTEWLRTKTQTIKYEIEQLSHRVERYTAMIAGWKLLPLVEVTEDTLLLEKSERDAKKAAREAAAQAKRDAEKAKQDATKAREKAEEDRVNAFYIEWGLKFAALAEEKPFAESYKVIRLQSDLCKAVRKAKFRGIHSRRVDAKRMLQDAALVKLKIAEPAPREGYFYYTGFYY